MKLLSSLVIAVFLTAGPSLADQFAQNRLAVIAMGSSAQDFAYDSTRGLIYVSIPALNEITIVSTRTLSIVNRVWIGSTPRGVDLSSDGNRLFVALNHAAAVGVLNLNTLETSEIIVGGSNGLGSSLAYDVCEAQPGRLFVTANPGSGGFSYVAQVDLLHDNAVSRAANNRIIRGAPTLLKSPNHDVVYIGEGFSPNSLYKLDLSQSSAPIILEDNHGDVNGTQWTGISPDGNRIYLSSGQVLRAESFLEAGYIGAGLPTAGNDGQWVFIAGNNNDINIYNARTFLMSEKITLPLTSSSNNNKAFDLITHGGDIGYALLRGTELVVSMPNIGDSDLNGHVDFTDFQQLLDNWQGAQKGWSNGDFTGDKIVEFSDFQLLLDNWNLVNPNAPIPEPITLSLLAVGAFTMLRRRR